MAAEWMKEIIDSVRNEIAESLRESIRTELVAELTGGNGTKPSAAQPRMTRSQMAKAVYQRETGQAMRLEGATDGSVTRRRRRRANRPSKAYTLTVQPRKNAQPPEWLFPTLLEVYDCIKAANGEPVTNRDIEKATGLKRKTVESNVWKLRNHNERGERVKPGSRSAMLQSTAIERDEK